MYLQERCCEYRRLLETSPDPMAAARVDYRRLRSVHLHKTGEASVAVVIPALNEAKRIERCLASLDATVGRFAQPVDVVVVDNGSSDMTGELARDFGVTVVKEPRRGIACARQAGLEATRPTIKDILTTDADCYVANNWIQRHYLALIDPEVCYSYGRLLLYLDSKCNFGTSLLFRAYLAGYSLGRELKNSVYSYIPMTGANSGYKREHALAVGGYRCDLAAHEDCFLCTDMLNTTGGIAADTKTVVLTSARRIIASGVWSYAISRILFNFRYYLLGKALEKPRDYPLVRI